MFFPLRVAIFHRSILYYFDRLSKDPSLNPVWEAFTAVWAPDESARFSDDEGGEDRPPAQLAIEDGRIGSDDDSDDLPTTQPEQSQEPDPYPYDRYGDRVEVMDDSYQNLGEIMDDTQPMELELPDTQPEWPESMEIPDSQIEFMEKQKINTPEPEQPDSQPVPEPDHSPEVPQPTMSEGPGKSSEFAMPPPPAITPVQRQEKLRRLEEIKYLD